MAWGCINRYLLLGKRFFLKKHYILQQKFMDQAVLSLDAFTELTDEDLKTELEINKIGHRRCLL